MSRAIRSNITLRGGVPSNSSVVIVESVTKFKSGEVKIEVARYFNEDKVSSGDYIDQKVYLVSPDDTNYIFSDQSESVTTIHALAYNYLKTLEDYRSSMDINV